MKRGKTSPRLFARRWLAPSLALGWLALSAWVQADPLGMRAIRRAFAAKDYARTEAMCLEVLSDAAATSKSREMACRLLVSARAYSGGEGLEEAIGQFVAVVFPGSAPSRRAEAFCEAMRARHALVSGRPADAAQVAKRILARGASADESEAGEMFCRPHIIEALYDVYARQYGAQAEERLANRLPGPGRARLACARYERTIDPSDALAALGQISQHGCPGVATVRWLRRMTLAVDEECLRQAELDKREFYKVLSAAAHRLNQKPEMAGAVDLMNRRATQLAIELRNDQLAGVE